MTITNGLCTLAEFKAANGLSDTYDDARIEAAIESASRQVEKHCGRMFRAESSATARVFTPSTSTVVHVDDFWDAATLVVEVDTGLSGTFTTWTSAAYQLEPLNGRRGGTYWPYTTLRALPAYYFPKSDGRASVRITAKWGWSAVPTDVKEATLQQAMFLWKVKEAPFGTAGFGEMGVVRVRERLHPAAVALLTDYTSSRVG